MRKTDIAIIGGGAAGLMAAYAAASDNTDIRVTVIEKMPRPGRKIMITGKGRCNFTNVKPWNEFSAHVHPKASALKPAFYNLPPEKLMRLFASWGLESVVERGDRAFPSTHQAASVVDALVNTCTSAGVEMMVSSPVEDLSVSDGLFAISLADGKLIVASRLIVATGGLSYRGTGSTGDGYAWLEGLGHKLRTCFPSLTALVPKGYKRECPEPEMRGHIRREAALSETGEKLCGIQLRNVALTAFIDGREVQSEFGDLDFTDGGIEGPLGFRLSRKCVNAVINGSKACLSIDLKPAVSQEDVENRVKVLWKEILEDERSEGKPYRTRFQVLLGRLMPKELIPGFLACNPSADHKSLGFLLKNWTMDVEGFVGYERAVVTAGGISTDGIYPKTMESRIVPGLYLAGEVLDLDADTGGYNLQTAFCTGYLAGLSAAESLK